MPIRINLRAEAQAAVELRRKDPVKRAIVLGAACVAVMVVVSLAIQSQVMSTNRNTCGLVVVVMMTISDAVLAGWALVFCVGANFIAIVGRVRAGDVGVVAFHIYLH